MWLTVIPATIPTQAVLIGILLSQSGLKRLDRRSDRIEERIDRLETKLEGKITSFEAKVDIRIDGLSRQIADGVVMLPGRDTEKADCVARLEEKSKS